MQFCIETSNCGYRASQRVAGPIEWEDWKDQQQIQEFRNVIKGDIKIPLLKLVSFCRKNIKCMLVEFCRSVTPSPHVRVKGHLRDDSQLSLYYTWQCFFVKWRQQSPTFCKGLNISRMQTFVMLPTEFDNLLLNAAGYFDISP